MALFRRGKGSDQGTTEAEETPQAPRRTTGPWDRSEVPGPEGRLDLGSVWLPGIPGMELRLEIDQTNGSVTGATAVVGDSSLQLQAFAAPRTLGVWDDIRDEIVASIVRSGGKAHVVDGPFGTEIAAELAQPDAFGRTIMAPVSFLGVDGPRWFLRGFLSGPAAADAQAAAPLLALFADTVVVRGPEAMAPRDLLPLRLPDQAALQEQAEADEPRAPGVDDLKPFERGPEITEVH